MGTRFNLLLPGMESSEGDLLFSSVVQELNRLENLLSCFIPSSPISYVNKQAAKHPVIIEDELFEILLDCYRYFKISFGLFDISLGKVIAFRNENRKELNLDTTFPKAGMDGIIFNKKDQSIQFNSSDVQLNLGAYGKGYALEEVVKLLQSRNVKTAYISFGESSIACIGKHPHGDYWPVGIPDYYKKDQILKSFKLTDEAISTSGNIDRNNHVLHPLTGLPLKEEMMVSVKTNSPVEAEVLSTVCMLANDDQIKTIIRQFSNVEIIKAIYRNKEVELLEYNF